MPQPSVSQPMPQPSVSQPMPQPSVSQPMPQPSVMSTHASTQCKRQPMVRNVLLPNKLAWEIFVDCIAYNISHIMSCSSSSLRTAICRTDFNNKNTEGLINHSKISLYIAYTMQSTLPTSPQSTSILLYWTAPMHGTTPWNHTAV